MANEKRIDVVDRNELLEAIGKSDRDNLHKGVANRSIHHYEHRHFMNMVMNAPTVDAVEVVHGRWEWYEALVNPYALCSICGCGLDKRDVLNFTYCPYCGAKMDGETG